MRKKLFSMAIAICMILSVLTFFPASAEADKTITVCDEKTVVNVLESYSNAYNSLDGKSVLAADGINVIVRPSDWLDFDVMVEEAGYYQVDFKGAVHDFPYHMWKIFVDSNEENFFYTWYMNGTNYEQEATDIYLPAGRHTIKFQNVGDRWNYFIQFSLTKKLNQAKSTFVFAPSYTSGLMADGVSPLPTDTGRIILHEGSWAEYNVNVAEAGKYYIALQTSWNYHGAIPIITVNGTDVKGLKMHESYQGEADRAYATTFSPAAYIDLNQGENTIRIKNTGNATMLRGFQLERIAEGAGFALQGDGFDSSTGGVGLEGSCAVLGSEKSISYEIDVPSSGLYRVAVEAGGGAGGSAGYSIYSDGEYLCTSTVVFKDWKANDLADVGVVELKEGKQTFTIRSSLLSSGHYLRSILVEKIGESTVVCDKPIKIEDDYLNVISAQNYEKAFNKNTLSTAALTVTEKSNVILTPYTTAKYHIDVPAKGVYTLSLKYASEANRNIMHVKVDNESVLTPRLQYAAEEGMITVELGDVTMTKGTHEIEFMNVCYENNSAPNVYLREFYIEKKNSDKEAKWLWAGDYSKQRDADGSYISQEGNFLSFQSRDEVDFEVRIHEAGIYRLDVMSGNENVNYEVKVDGEVMDWLGTNLTKRYTGNIENQVAQPICELYFAEEGLYTITLKNSGGGHYLQRIKLTPVDSVEIPSIYYYATDYIEAYNADAVVANGETENTMPVEGGNIKFGVGDKITYDVPTFDDGYYRILMVGGHGNKEVNKVSVAVNDEEATHVGEYVGSGNWNSLNVCDLGLVYIPGGNNTLTLETISGTIVYYYALIIEPVTNVSESSVVAGDYSSIDLQKTSGAEAVISGGFNGVKLNDNSAASYNLDVEVEGAYNVFVTAEISDAKDITVTLGDESKVISVANSAGSDYVTFNAGAFVLTEGETPFEISADGGELVISKVTFEKASDVAINLIKTIDGKSVVDNKLTEGDFTACVSFNNDNNNGKEFIFTFAIYKTDANGVKKIDKIASQTKAVSGNEITLDMEDVEFAEGYTYSASAYAWDVSTLYGVSKGF